MPEEKTHERVSTPLTEEMIQSIPVATSDMSISELRQLCVRFFRLQNGFVWTPDASHDYVIRTSKIHKYFEPGIQFGGLPYVSTASGNIYRALDFMDSEKGILHIKEAFEDELLFGTQCACGADWAWSRVITSVNGYCWCRQRKHTNGFLRLGPYTYDDAMEEFTKEYGPKEICRENGKEVMFESYAKMLPGDGVLCWGHVEMVSSKARVWRNDDGSIDGKKSHVFLCDQGQGWKFSLHPDGTEFRHMGSIDEFVTFDYLYETGWLPFTFAEFQGEKKIEKSRISIQLPKHATVKELKEAKVISNYPISDLYLVIEEGGKEEYRKAARTRYPYTYSLSLGDAVSEEELSSLRGKSIKILCRISTGEKPVIYEGILAE